jgi:hypothetical protein
MNIKRIIGLIVMLYMLTGLAPAVQASNPPDQQQTAIGQTPPRLSFVDGQVSFWRPGSRDWTQAQLNTPLAPGDRLYTGSPGNLELQIGSRAFVRGWANTQIGLVNREPDFLQFEVTTGYASFDLRTLEPGRTVEVDTPNAVFTIDHAGYYRVDVNGERTSLIARRGGQATVTLGSGESLTIAPSEEVVIEGLSNPIVTSYTAPELDEWDNWNYARTDYLLETVSARYVSPDIYGAGDLDLHGTWRVVPTYGPVWVPTAVPAGWAPYSTGSWILDPYYGWTWVDTAPWGWAPYHYGRWVFVNGYWGWAPGPVLVRPVYAPALVAFFGAPGVAVNVAIGGGPVVGWVALGWGEPLVPWWGPRGFIHRPWWGGWGGPRVVNNVVINKTTIVNVENINVYRNANVHNAVVAVNKNHFGRGPITSTRLAKVDAKNLRPIHAAPRIDPTPASFKPNTKRGIRPSEASLKKPVVATRPPHTAVKSNLAKKPNMAQGKDSRPRQLVGAPKQREADPALPRPRFGNSKIERPMGDRAPRSTPPKFEAPRQTEKVSKARPNVSRQAAPQSRREPRVTAPLKAVPQPQARSKTPIAGPSSAAIQSRGQSKTPASGPSAAVTQPQARRPIVVSPQKRQLPGEPANQISPNRVRTQNVPSTMMKSAPRQMPQGRFLQGRP